MKFCDKCGAQMEDNVAACPVCGAPMDFDLEAAVLRKTGQMMEDTPAEPPVTPTPQPAVTPAPRVEPAYEEVRQQKQEASKKPLIIGICCGVGAVIVLFVVLLVTGVISFGGSKTEDVVAGAGSTQGAAAETASPEPTEDASEPVEGAPEGDPTYMIEGSDSRFLEDSDLKGMSKQDLRIARNEIYARHGCSFKDKVLNSFFTSKAWYNPTVSVGDFDESVFNKYERANVKKILEKESGPKLKDGTYVSQDGGWKIYAEKMDGGKKAKIQLVKRTEWGFEYTIIFKNEIKDGKISIKDEGGQIAMSISGTITVKKDSLKCSLRGDAFTAKWKESDTEYVEDLESLNEEDFEE